MHRYLLFLLLLGIVIAGSAPYVSPGFQIGMNTNGNFFISTQTTVGYLSSDGLPSNFGITLGLRMYYLETVWKKYRYIDFQFWPVITGFGVGKMIDDKKNMYTRYKTGFGVLGYLTYDYCKIPKIGNHNFFASNIVIGGKSKIGDLCFMGFSSTIADYIQVDNEVLIGAHSFLNQNAESLTRYQGIPAILYSKIDEENGITFKNH